MRPNKNYTLVTDSIQKKALLKNKNFDNKNLAVFVHGFNGDYLSTWGNFPQLLMSDPKLSSYDFMFWGYSSNLLTSKEKFIHENIKQLFIQFLSKHKTNQHIEVVAQGLQTELKYLEEYDNISLIGHSMGGLVIRSYIIQNLKENKKENLEKIKQIILFGTPNEGLGIANNKLLSGLNSQIHDMGSYNDFINILREDWVELVFKNKDLNFSTLMVAGEDDHFVPFEQVTKYFRDSRELTQGDHETMVKPASVNDMSYRIVANNLLKVKELNGFKGGNSSASDKQTGFSHDQLQDLLDKIGKLIAERGLDDETWSKTIGGQYFLINLARMLNLTANSDYFNLMDLFLKSFNIKVDNSIVLSEDKIKMTPELLAKMKKSMIEEDNKDDYYSRYSKNAAQNIDMQLIKANYNYGLMVQMSQSKELPNSLILDLINELVVNRLIYGNGKKSIEDHGGWYPQRIPWVTARILIALKNSGYEKRQDKNYINEVALKAIDYLLRSIYQDKYWRSGVGDWVTDWETTALCLEAIDQWDGTKANETKILPILHYVLVHEDEWLKAPSFDSEKDSNATIASVTLLCNILIIINNNFKESFDIDYNKYFEYLSEVFEEIAKSTKVMVKQHCTIPQITFYGTKLALTIEGLVN